MKTKIFLAAFALLFANAAFAQKPVITFDKTTHDFGTVKEEDGKISCVFEFTNTGDAKLKLSNVQASCGCTTPQWSRDSIAPGEKGTINVAYNASGRPGGFTKTVTVTSNAERVVLTIKGNVTPKAQKVEDTYPVKIGENFRIKANPVNFGEILSGNVSEVKLPIVNTSEKEQIITFVKLPKHIVAKTDTLKAGERGNLSLSINTANVKEWGTVKTPLVFTTNPKDKAALDTVIVQFAVIEKFTPEQRENAPKAVIENPESAKLQVGTKTTVKAVIKNEGKSDLLIRKAESTFPDLKVEKMPKKVAAGKSAEITVSIDAANLNPIAYSKYITLTVNEPNATRKNIMVNFQVQQ